MSMDGPGAPPPPSPQSGDSSGSSATSSPQGGRKRRGRRNKSGRTVDAEATPTQGAAATGSSTPPVQSPLATVQTSESSTSTGAPTEAIKGRAVGKKMTPKEAAESGNLLDQKLEEINDFFESNFPDLSEVKFVITPENGYSQASRLLQVSMEQFKALLDEHRILLDKTYRAITQNEGRRKQMEKNLQCALGFRHHSKETDQELVELVSLAKRDNLDKKYWQHRAVIAKYCDLCLRQYAPCSKTVRALIKSQGLSGFKDRIAEVISVSMECSKAHGELVLCLKMLGKDAEVEECRKHVVGPGLLVLMALDVGMAHFFFEEMPRFRELMNQYEKYYLGWVERYDPKTDRTLNDKDSVVIDLICACLVMDHPKKAIRFAHHFLENLQKEKYEYGGVLMLILKTMEAYPFLYTDQPENFAEQERRMNEGAELLNMIRLIVRYAVNNNLGTPEETENLIFLFNGVEGGFNYHHAKVRARYDQAQALGDQLIQEEDAQAKRIRDRLLKREEQRQKKEAKRLESQDTGSNSDSIDTGTANEPDAPVAAETEVSLHPGLQGGILAYVRKQPLNKVLNEFKKVEDDDEASAFDKIQAKYGCADVVAASLQKRVVEFKRMAEDVKQYDLALRRGEVPSVESDIAFRDALATYKANIQGLTFDTLRMCQTFKQAWDKFFTQEELQDDFIDRLIELHDEMKQLTEDGEEIAKCCANIPDIYARRGTMIQNRGLSSKGNPERHRVMAENVRVLETDSDRVRRSFDHLKMTINIEWFNEASGKKSNTAEVVEIPKDVVSEYPEPEVSVSPLETVSPPAQVAPSVGSNLMAAGATSEVISIPVLPPELAREIQQKTGRTVSAKEYGADVSVETIGYQSQQWLPDSGCDPHPLSLLAQHLDTPLLVRIVKKRWYIAPGKAPADVESLAIAIPKKSLNLDYPFAVTQPSVAPETSVEESAVQTPPAPESVVSVETVERPAPPLELPLQSLLPPDIGAALMRSLRDSGEHWEATATGLRIKKEEWEEVKGGKKGKKGKKGRATKMVEPLPSSEDSEMPKITVLNLQALLRKQLRSFMNDPKHLKRKVPPGFDIDGVIKRACEGRLFMEGRHEDFCVLSRALNMPLKVAFRVNNVFGYRPDMQLPAALGIHGEPDENHLSLESYSSGGRDYWFASVGHYFEWGDAQDEAEVERKIEQEEKKKIKRRKGVG